MIIAGYYLYTALRKGEEFYFDGFLAILTSKIKIEKHKSELQVRKPPIGHCRNVRGLRKSVIVFRLFEILR